MNVGWSSNLKTSKDEKGVNLLHANVIDPADKKIKLPDFTKNM